WFIQQALNTAAVKNLVGIDFPVDEVYMYPGAIKHVRKNHPGIIESYGHLIPDMIANPDFIGQHPKVPNSLEIIKVVSDHLLLSIQLDPSGYLYVSTFFELNNGHNKIKKRLASGRIVPYKD
ncbi:PBECR2 nuclease fold domain-containing protein, partial [Paenibacillus naphthalenovorans]|uniref:PBECR3 domain-containing polyvalent protein n=1 Tax=Paenibacillus naphthalenovorans TaxID=162209 RepID=UPI003D2AB0F2